MYIELDHALVPRKVGDINERSELPGRVQGGPGRVQGGPGRAQKYKLKKYEVKKGNIQNVFLAFEINKIERKVEAAEQMKGKYFNKGAPKTKECREENHKIDVKACEPVIGPSEDVLYDEDLGFFSAILACYNNHWVLRTSPNDWWNVIVRNVAQAVDDNGDKERVRQLFVDHEGKKKIEVILPHLATVDYSWLFDQFSRGIKNNVKVPGYVDLMQADFSTTTPHQLISSQVMLMSSLQKYFSYGFGTLCGIPGVEMKGTREDWVKLIEKTRELGELLKPVMEDIDLGDWFKTTETILQKLLDTFNGSPDKEWWSHILSWNQTYGSGARSWWNGWMIDFLRAGRAENPRDFQSGTVSVPVHIFEDGGPEDDGLLVAGTVGYTVQEQEVAGGRAPVVEARQSWVLLLPKGSPITPYLTGGEGKRVV
eukprot:GFUD01107661.1.p1 GENE.GFUD01107661.1~~GFUD01107661.1.p1  ORF type:complete len:425 (-),score=138.15 GFUD01107661.1:503-1777(-)